MFLNIQDTAKDYEFDFTASPFDNKKERQKVEILINENKVSEFEFPQTQEFSAFNFKVPGTLFKQGTNELVFKYRYSTTPKELNISSDGRKLSVLFQKMFIKTLQQ